MGEETNGARRRYFVIEVPDVPAVIAEVTAQHDAHMERMKALTEKYGAKDLLVNRDRVPYALLMDPAAPVPDGTKDRGMHEGLRECRPVLNRKVGCLINKEMQAVGGFRTSKTLLKRFSCDRMIIVGRASWVSTAGFCKGQIVVQVPQHDDKPFVPPEYFREIKKSEFIALTEE